MAAGYSRGKEGAQDAAAQARRRRRDRCRCTRAASTIPQDCQRVVAEVLERFGRIDYLVNNAGITVDKTVRKMTFDDWHNVLNVNLFGAFG